MSSTLNAAAGLDWRIYQVPAYLFASDNALQPVCDPSGVVQMQPTSGHFKLIGSQRQHGEPVVPDYYLNVRDDLQQVVGIVRHRYRVVQNAEAPVFLDQLVLSGEAVWETAGSRHRGSQVFWIMKLAGGEAIAGDAHDELETFLMLTNSHDGSTSLVVSTLSYRPATSMTFAWPVPSASRTMKVRHTDSSRGAGIEARRALELGRNYQAKLAEVAERMLRIPVSETEFLSFLDHLIPTPKPVIRNNRTTNQRGITVADNTKGGIVQIYFHNEAFADTRGTLWGAVQAARSTPTTSQRIGTPTVPLQQRTASSA